MSIWMFLKTFGDLCLFFSVIGAFPGLFPHSISFLWPVICCSFGVFGATALSLRGKGNLRYLGLIPCMVPLVLVTGVADFLVILLAVAYCFFVVHRDRIAIDYVQYRTFFMRSIAILAGFLVIISLFCAFETVLLLREESTLNYEIPLQYSLLYCVAAVPLLRALRLGEEGTASRMNRRQEGVLLGSASAVLIGTALLERMLRQQDVSVFQKLFMDTAAALVTPIFWLFGKAQTVLPEYDHGFDEIWESSGSGTGSAQSPPTAEVVPSIPPEAEEAGFPWWLVGLILILTALILAVMVGGYARRKAIVRSVESVTQLHREKEVAKAPRWSHRSRVRQLYREFLKHQRNRGVKLTKDQTSLDVLQQISRDTDAEGARQLREVYLQARYDSAHEVSRLQLEEGRKALKKSIR